MIPLWCEYNGNLDGVTVQLGERNYYIVTERI